VVIVHFINVAFCRIYRKKSVVMMRFMREVVATCVADSRSTTRSSTNAADRTMDLDSRLLAPLARTPRSYPERNTEPFSSAFYVLIDA
jgi:hypothetical protein